MTNDLGKTAPTPNFTWSFGENNEICRGAGYAATLTITNSGKDITFKKETGQPTEDNCNFELIFPVKPKQMISTISDPQTKGWEMQRYTKLSGRGKGDYFRFLYTGNTDVVLKNGDTLKISFSNITAFNVEGKQTVTLELGPKSLFNNTTGDNLDNPDQDEDIKVVAAPVLPPAPLTATVVGPNTVINDGSTASTIKLRIANTSLRNIAVNSDSKFILHFDFGSEDYDLLSVAEVADISATAGTGWTAAKNTDGANTTWNITPNSGTTSIPVHGGILLTITIDKTSAATGGTNAYVAYEKIDAYADGQVVAVLQKTPLAFSNTGLTIHGDLTTTSGITSEGAVTIGTDKTNQNLTVNGSLSAKSGIPKFEQKSVNSYEALNEGRYFNNFDKRYFRYFRFDFSSDVDSCFLMLSYAQMTSKEDPYFEFGVIYNQRNKKDITDSSNIELIYEIDGKTVYVAAQNGGSAGVDFYLTVVAVLK